MKNLYFFCLILLFSLISVSFVSALCINSADSYAVEVLLSKEGINPNLNMLNSAQNVIIQDNKYFLQSSYSPSLALILEKVSSPISGLSVRLQIPIKLEQQNLPYLKLSSTALKGNLNVSKELHNGWAISCSEGFPVQQCEFNKEKTNLLVSLISQQRYELVIETREDFKNCKDCDGSCLVAADPKCISKNFGSDVEEVLNYAGLTSSIDEILASYKVISLGSSNINELKPEVIEKIGWKEAIKQELKRLNRESIISISDSDIDEISSLAEQGAAGQNSRIVFAEDSYGNKRWLYYYETNFPTLTKLENCQEFPLSLVPTGLAISPQQAISTYYLVPIVFTSSLIALLIILIVAARLIDSNRKKRRIKPILNLTAN